MADPTEVKRYINIENVLNKINQKYISLPDEETKRNAEILKALIIAIEGKMKEYDTLFKTMYERMFYGGSYYDGLKISKPEEYDLDLVLNLPLIIEPVVEMSNKHGFVHVKILEYNKMEGRPEHSRYPKLSRIMEDKYVSTVKVLQWIESVISNAFKKFDRDVNGRVYFEVNLNSQKTRFYLTYTKEGPAFTMHVVNEPLKIKLDVDLVTCFQFTDKQWPKGRYKKNPVPTRNKFLVVPKKPHDSGNMTHSSRYWRLSFQEQERDLLKGEQYNGVKPSLKLLKFLKDKYKHKIASYFIKTIFLWEVEKQKDVKFWRKPLSFVFITMLKAYENMLRQKNIPYFWNPQYNLIAYLNETTIINIANTMKRMIDDIERNIDNPLTVAKYFVSNKEVEQLRNEVELSKKLVSLKV